MVVMPKMLYFIVGAAKVGTIETLQLVKPGLTNPERAELLLDKVRASEPNRRFELLAIEARAFAGVL